MTRGHLVGVADDPRSSTACLATRSATGMLQIASVASGCISQCAAFAGRPASRADRVDHRKVFKRGFCLVIGSVLMGVAFFHWVDVAARAFCPYLCATFAVRKGLNVPLRKRSEPRPALTPVGGQADPPGSFVPASAAVCDSQRCRSCASPVVRVSVGLKRVADADEAAAGSHRLAM